MSVVADVVHRPGPLPDEAPYSRYCLECRHLWPCEERLAAVEPAEPAVRRDRELGEQAIVDGVGIGWHVEGAEGMRFHHRTGGTVVSYSDQWTGDDLDRCYRVLNWHHGLPTVVTLASADVEPTGVRPPNKYTLEGHAVALAEHVSKGHGTETQKLEWLKMAVACMERAV